MATKQELQESIKKMVVVANNPKTSEAIRKTLLKSIEKAESQVKELEKAETLEKKEEELTEKQEQKVEAVKEESKKLVQSLKGKIKTAKSSGAKTKKSTPPSSKLMQKAKELARKYRTAQKGVPTGDFDIERDAGRPAMPKGKRIAKKSGKTYYENRENRIDRKQPPKTYPKLADGGEVVITFEEFKRKLPELHDIKWGDKGVKYVAKRNPYTDRIVYFKNGRINSEKVSLEKAYEHYKYFLEKGEKYADGGMMAKGGIYSSDDVWIVTFQNQDSGELEKISVRANNKKNAIAIAEDESGLSGDWQYYSADKKMASGGMMANGGWYVVSAKDGKVVSSAFKSENEAKKYMYELFEKNDDFSLAVKKMASGGMMAKGGFVVVNLGGDRYDGGVAYQIMKGDKIVKDGLIDGDHGVEFEGKKYDGLKSLADGIGAKLVTQKMASGGMMAKGGKVKEIEFDGTKWYLTYDDPTHFFLSNSPDFKGNPYHIGQFKSRPFYNEVNEWLKETSRNSKMEYGGILQPMTGGVNADPRFDIYDTGAFMKKGGKVKRAMRYEDGGMNEGGEFEYLIMYRSDNPTYQNEDGFEGNPPDSMYADSPFDVLDYLRDNMPDDVELISIEEASDVYKKGGSLQSIKNKYEENEDENAHSENVVLLAKHFGTKEELAEAKKILSIHNKEGHLSTENGQKRRELHLKLIEKAREQMSKEGIEFEYGGILQPMTGGVNADPRFDIYSPDFMAKGGYMADGGDTYLNLSEDERMEVKNLKGLIEETMEAIDVHEKRAEKSDDKELRSYHENKVKENKRVLADRKSRLEILRKRGMAKGGYMADGGLVKVKWSDAEYGDSARVIAENKMGLILKPYGQKFHLKFPDGTEKTYTANELEFYKEESYKKGGKTNEQSENLQMLKNQSKEFGHHAKELQTALKSNPKVDAWVVAKSERASTDLSDITHYLDGMKNTMAMGGVTEHGLKEGDEIVVAHDNIIVVLNKKTGESAFINIETGKREDATYLKDKLMMMSTMENGGKVSLEKMYEKFREQSMAVRLKIATLIGIDTASEYLYRDLVVNPFSLIEGAVRKGFITIDEINKNVWDAAVSESNSIEDSYRDSGEGIGSSDMNAFISSMLNDAGIKVVVKDNTYQRMAKGGMIPIEKKGDQKIATVIHNGNVFFVEYYIDNPELKHIKGTNINTYFGVFDNKYSYGKSDKEYKAVTKKLINAIKTNKVVYYGEGGNLAKGGEVKVGDKVKSKSGVEGEVYDTTGMFFKLKDKFGNKNPKLYSVRDFKPSEIKSMAKGGKVKFADKVASVKKSLLERKKVPKAVQKDYGKTFSPAEAEDSAKRIVGAKTYAERIKYLAKKNKK